MEKNQKIIIYQVFTRLFGNVNESRIPGGSILQNGCGRLADFTGNALNEIRRLGATHVWYTGILEHATQTDYRRYGIRPDHPAMVKGRAGSPYAIKDYYDIDPDLARDVPERRHEFDLLVKRTHRAGLKVVIDFVPNHVARQYHSDAQRHGKQLGEDDDPRLAFSPQNNFYYIPGQALQPQFDTQDEDTLPYREYPARATGNDRFDAYPTRNDWYETVKLNYGVDYVGGGTRHFDPVPDTWCKMRHILLFWASQGVDGFRCDMAEMVPVEFWQWAIPQVKAQYPGLLFIAEVYNPALYRDYLMRGHFDYLYDKVGLYDTLRAIVEGRQSATAIPRCWQSLEGIEGRMLNFLENHDEQRIASDFFAADPFKAIPALAVSALMNTNPFMLYFGQELGERGMDAEGFSGRDGRTTIFDYWCVDTIRRWRNAGKFDGKLLTEAEQHLQDTYRRILTLCNEEPAIVHGQFFDLTYANVGGWRFNEHRHYAFLRHQDQEALLIVANFDPQEASVAVNLPQHAFDCLGMTPLDTCTATDLLTSAAEAISFTPARATDLTVPGYGVKILKISWKQSPK